MTRSLLYRSIGLCLGLAAAAQGGFALSPVIIAEKPIQEQSLGHVIGVGMAFDGEDDTRPATIAFLYEELNAEILASGDVVLEYRGFPVSSGADLYRVIQMLPDVAPGDTVEIVLFRPSTGETLIAEPVAAALAPKVTETTFPDRACKKDGDDCKCSSPSIGSSCIRRIHSVLAPDGTTMSTSSSCDDGVNICPKPRPVKKKGK